MPLPTPTLEQAAILDALPSGKPIIIEALAGTGKTTTILQLVSSLPQIRSALILAFNKKIAEEIAPRLPSNAEAKTLNSLGHGAWQRHIGKRLRLDTNKLRTLLNQMLEHQKKSLTFTEKKTVIDLTNAIRTHNTQDWDFLWEWIEETPDLSLQPFVLSLLSLSETEARNGYIDFADQIYMPVRDSVKFPKVSLLLVDEAQDLSPLNLSFISLIPATQRVFVGDPNQAIYAFRGADHAAMENISLSHPDALHFPLSVTFRCPKSIVTRAQSYVPHYTAAPSNPPGEVLTWDKWSPSNLPPSCAIISRNNAPLVTMALRLLSCRIPCTILGREFATSILRDIKRAAPENCDLPTLERKLRDYYNSKMKGQISSAKTAQINDKLDAILAAARSATDRDSLLSILEKLFSDSPTKITLCTGHKSKGLEWDTTIHLDPHLIPSKWARTTPELTQENNLRYVIETRAKSSLILATTEGFSLQ